MSVIDESEYVYEAVVIGAGFAGMYALHVLRDRLGLSTSAFEAGGGVGGTWYWNRYPGARCDVRSLEYSYTFDDELYRRWTWAERYATQPEMERYANYVADALDLRRDIRFETRIVAMRWNDASARWSIETDCGDRVEAAFVLACTGPLSAWQIPRFPGLERFGGETYHTGAWPREHVELSGKRVAVIGTGSSGVQVIPAIAEQAAQLTVFQRTANFSLPAGQTRLDPEVQADRKRHLAEWRESAFRSYAGVPNPVPDRSVFEDGREKAYERFESLWGEATGFALMRAYNDLATSEEANTIAADFIRHKIREIVTDPDTAEKLCPKDHPLGGKRIIIDTNYFETYNRDNVQLVDVRATPIATLTSAGIQLEDGCEFSFDVIVFATGYDAMTGALTRIDIRGDQGRTLNDAWAEGPKTYLGLQVAGFPNLFTITGPGSPSVLCSMILASEQHVDWVADCITYLREHCFDTIDPTPEAQETWVAHVNDVAAKTLFMKANSWYLGANIPGKPRVFMPYVGGMHTYKEKCDDAAASGYEGFSLERRAIHAT